MARGWESKEVEQQIEAAEARKAERKQVVLNAEEAVRFREMDSLQMSRLRVASDLTAATNPRHRAMLELALADLDKKIAEFGETGTLDA